MEIIEDLENVDGNSSNSEEGVGSGIAKTENL